MTHDVLETDSSSKSNEQHPTTTHHSIRGILLIMLGSLSFSVMYLLAKLMKDMNTFTLVFWRSIVQGGISLIDLHKKRVNPLGPNDSSVRFYLVMRGTCGAFAVCAWFFGVQILPLPDAVTLQFTTPPFAAAFAVCMVGEHWKILDAIGAVVCLTGVALIAHPTWLFGGEVVEENNASVALKGAAVLVTTLGAAMAGIAYVSVRKIGDRADAVVMVLYYAALSIPMTFIGSRMFLGEWNVWGDVESFTVKDYLLLLLLGFAGYGGQWFTNLGLQNETAATATLATTTQIVWTYIFELLFLHEAMNIWSFSGTALILGYMMVVGMIKMIESGKHVENDEEKLLLDVNMSKGYDTTDRSSGSSSPLPLHDDSRRRSSQRGSITENIIVCDFGNTKNLLED